jgi:hypothetical protein
VPALITITSPESNADIVLGSAIVVRGVGQREASQTVWLALVTLNGRLLLETQATTSDTGWEAGFTVPVFVSGTAVLQASIRSESGEVAALHSAPINLVLDTASSDRYLALFHPLQDETAVSGFNLFFDGRVQRPVNNTVTVSVWTEQCQNQVARQSFILRGSGYWQGFLIVPRDVSGPACAVAHFGVPGEESWRETLIPINILPTDDEAAKGIRIGNPPSGSTFTAGQELFLYGTALNVVVGEVQVSILLENGRIVSQSSTLTDYWGYWELSIFLPADVEGPAEITVSSGTADESDYTETKTRITIEPAPTPTPGP